MSVQKLAFLLLFSFLLQPASAQGGVVVKTNADRNKILIGEPIRLTIEADIPADAPIAFVKIDSIEHFEFLSKPRIDTVNTKTGTIIKGIFQLTSFDSGHWVIPSFVLTGNINTDSIPVDVGYTPFDTNQNYHDIKDILDVEVKTKTPWWWYAIGGAGLLFLLVFLYSIFSKKKAPATQVQHAVNAYEDAMQQLEKLRKEKPEAKEYYSRLTDIFRLYVSRKKGIQSLQKTTDGIVIQLKELGLQDERFQRLAQALRTSDFVKFAKFLPGPEDDRSVFETIKSTIEDLNKSA